MVGIQDWFNVYTGIRDNVLALKSALEGTKTALDQIKVDLDAVRADLKGTGNLNDLSLANQITKIAHWIETNVAPNLSTLADTLSPIEGSFALPVLKKLDTLNQTLAVSGADQTAMSDAIVQLVTELTAPGSDNYIEAIRKYYSGVGARLKQENEQIEAQTQADRERVVGAIIEKGEQTVTKAIEKGIKFADPLLRILEVPFSAIVSAALKEFTDAFTENKPANPYAARELVTKGITQAYKMGEAAHILSASAELFQPLKQMGFPQLAAALGDLSGFKEISSTLSRALITASITRPLRWWGNVEFRPEILAVRDLVELVGKRELSLTDFAQVLYQHGHTREDVDLLTKAVWREPTIRDLAIAIEDTSVPDDWLLERVRRAGYEDADAEQLTRSLIQRSLKAARGRVISAALASVTDGLLDTESYRTILESLSLRQDEIDLQIRTAEIAARRDTVNTAIATYKRMYVNGPIERSDFTLALTVLGVNPDRVELIALDADAQRAPKIAREEDAKIKEAVREIQRELVPRYRRLYELGVIDDAAYEAILVEAGISPQVAAQAVLLDRQKRQIVLQTATASALERETAQLVSETETALRLQFRKGLLDEAQLRNSLHDLGYGDEKVRVIVEQERARLAPTPSKTISAPEEAKARVLRDLAVQTALNDFRKGRIEALDLYDELVAQGMTEDEALARVNLEISRLPVPTATATGTPQ